MAKGIKSGGRIKGTPNKDSAPVTAVAARLGIDPFEVLLRFAMGDWKNLGYETEQYISSANENGTFYKWTIDPAVRMKAAAEASQYLYPKKKALELSADSENAGIKIIIEDYSKK